MARKYVSGAWRRFLDHGSVEYQNIFRVSENRKRKVVILKSGTFNPGSVVNGRVVKNWYITTIEAPTSNQPVCIEFEDGGKSLRAIVSDL